MGNRGKLKMETEPKASLGSIKKENEIDPLFSYNHHNINKYKFGDNCYQESIKEEFDDKINDMQKTDPLALSDGENEATSINENKNGIKRNLIKDEPTYIKIIKVESESISIQYNYSELKDDKQNIDIKENIIESSADNSDVTSTSGYEDSNKHASSKYFGRETISKSDSETVFTCQKNGKILYEGHHFGFIHSSIKNCESHKCKETFTASSSLNTHLSIVQEFKNKCEECDKNFAQLDTLQRHIKTVHNGIRKYKCPKCKKTFTRSDSLERHISSIHEGVKYGCEACRKCFTQLGNLQKHINTVHSKIKKYKCKKCQKSFTTLKGLKHHISSIHEGIKYKCNECKKCFTRLETLQMHIYIVHIGVKKYECQKCKKVFTASNNLNTHINSTHKGIKYKCEDCEKSFTRLAHLRGHIETVHNESRRFRCQKCKKTFATSGSLKRHTSVIHDGIKYKCKEYNKNV